MNWLQDFPRKLAISILVITLITIAFKEMLRVFIELGLLQFIGVVSIGLLVIGIIDKLQDGEIIERIYGLIEDIVDWAEEKLSPQ